MDNMKDKKLEDICGKENPFTVPEGYFEHLTQTVMDRLPERRFTTPEPQHISMWQRVKPWIYLAAMFCGIMVGARYVFAPSMQEVAENTQITSRMMTPDEAQEPSYEDIYLEDALMNSRMDDYSVYCYLTDVDDEG